ncbi:MAG: DNA-protecting protein DprA, partial [Desulfatitalea sp.]|nr:DNA-protecting protein DprA [Desulfatitalea sp.]
MEYLVPWLTLKSVPEIGNLLFTRLVGHFGSPERVLSAPANALGQVDGITPRLAQAIQRHRTPDWVFKEIDQAAQKGYAIVPFHSDAYPALLKQIPDPPPVLFVHGRLEKPFCPIAVVGSRKATTYGLTTTHRLCAQLAERGATVVSGMARGIDTAAHQGALAGKGHTIAVLGSGLNQIYPAENRKLFQQIAENGCVVSEFFMDAAPEPHHFPMRNRVISGMSLGTVVVEAARNSGSLITARLASEQNREVFAVPGSIHSATAKGTHDLIKQGAKLV